MGQSLGEILNRPYVDDRLPLFFFFVNLQQIVPVQGRGQDFRKGEAKVKRIMQKFEPEATSSN